MSRFGFTSEVRTIVVGSEFVRYPLSQGMPIKPCPYRKPHPASEQPRIG